MRAIFALAVGALGLSAAAHAGPTTRYVIDSTTSDIEAKVAYFGLATKAVAFPKVDGTVDLDPDNPGEATIDVTIDARELKTSDDFVLERLKGTDFFWVERFPAVVFVGRGLALDSDVTGKVNGTLTARGVTRPATLTVTFSQPLSAQAPARSIDLVGKIVIDRRDFGMTAFPLIVGSRVDVTLTTRMMPR